jgi:hypothetical protein
MLTEIRFKADSKSEKRWYQDEYFDLFIWQDETEQITSFQLCYDRLGDERVIYWDSERGFAHYRVDDGEDSPHKNMSPVLVRTGELPSNEVFTLFVQSSQLMDSDLSRFIIQKLDEYIHYRCSEK